MNMEEKIVLKIILCGHHLRDHVAEYGYNSLAVKGDPSECLGCRVAGSVKQRQPRGRSEGEGKMTFDSIDRALDYLSGQNPGKIAIVAPVRRDDGVVAYHIEFHSPDGVMTRAIPHARIIQLGMTPGGGWDLKIVGLPPPQPMRKR